MSAEIETPDVAESPTAEQTADMASLEHISKAMQEEPETTTEPAEAAATETEEADGDEQAEEKTPVIPEDLKASALAAGFDEEELAAFTPAQLKAMIRVASKTPAPAPTLFPAEMVSAVTPEAIAKIKEEHGEDIAGIIEAQEKRIAALTGHMQATIQAEQARQAAETTRVLNTMFDEAGDEYAPIFGKGDKVTDEQWRTRDKIIQRMTEINSGAKQKYDIKTLFREAAFGPLADTIRKTERTKFAQAAKKNASAATFRPGNSTSRRSAGDPDVASLDYIKEKMAEG